MTIRPSLRTIIVFVTLGLVICLPGFDSLLRLGQWREGSVFVLTGGVFMVTPLWRYRISWDERMLVYRGLITTREIQFSEVKKFDVRGPSPDDRYGPTLGLRIFSKSSKKPVMTINLKVFARSDIARLIERLKETTS
jgi:hypothetical protein